MSESKFPNRLNQPLGLVLAGGEGRRLGGPKADRHFAGRTWAEHAAVHLEPLCKEVLVSVRSTDQIVGVEGYRTQVDPLPGGQGPLPAIVLALRSAPLGLWVLACDYLLLQTRTLARLTPVPDTTSEGPAATFYRDGQDRLHPLAGFWSHRALPTLERRLAAGERSVLAALGGLSLNVKTAADVPGLDLDRELLNVNRPEDIPGSRTRS